MLRGRLTVACSNIVEGPPGPVIFSILPVQRKTGRAHDRQDFEISYASSLSILGPSAWLKQRKLEAIAKRPDRTHRRPLCSPQQPPRTRPQYVQVSKNTREFLSILPRTYLPMEDHTHTQLPCHGGQHLKRRLRNLNPSCRRAVGS